MQTNTITIDQTSPEKRSLSSKKGGETIQQHQIIAKAPSSWRRGDSVDSRKELVRDPSLARYQVDNPHQKRV